jgi:hypothetical protein
MDPRAILEELTGIGGRLCEPTVDDMPKICAALVSLIGDYYVHYGGDSISVMCAIKSASEMLIRIPPGRIAYEMKTAIERLDTLKTLKRRP